MTENKAGREERKQCVGTYGGALGSVLRRPFIIIFLGVVTLAFCIINYYNPVFTLMFGLQGLKGGNLLDGMMSFIQLPVGFVSDAGTAVKALAAVIFILAVFSIIAGIALSGFFHILNTALEGKKELKGGFMHGIGKYFFKTVLINFRAGFFGILFILFMMVASVPAIITTKTLTAGRTELLLPVIFLDILTAVVLFFSFMAFRIYMFFWYPSAFNTEKSAFITGKRTADKHFWRITGSMVLFDLVLAAFQILIMYLQNIASVHKTGITPLPAVLFMANWIFKTAYFTFFMTYIFHAFKKYYLQK